MNDTPNRSGPLSFKLAQLRMEEGYSYKEYGELFGISAHRLRAVENGSMPKFTPDEMLRIARYHGVSLDELFVEALPIPDRLTRAIQRLKNNYNLDRLDYLISFGEGLAVDVLDIPESVTRTWKNHSRVYRFREKGLIVI
jgi:transcriptional regulator with XRE-family HTH domain